MQSKNAEKTERRQYSPPFKEQALERAKREGVVKAARDLGIAEAILYNWRAKSKQIGISFEDQKLKEAELARLKRELAKSREEISFLKKAAAYFAAIESK